MRWNLYLFLVQNLIDKCWVFLQRYFFYGLLYTIQSSLHESQSKYVQNNKLNASEHEIATEKNDFFPLSNNFILNYRYDTAKPARSHVYQKYSLVVRSINEQTSAYQTNGDRNKICNLKSVAQVIFSILRFYPLRGWI